MKKRNAMFISVIPLLVTLGGFFSVRHCGFVLVTVPGDNSFHFSLMTVNALFGGFLYTNYGVLINLLDNPLVQKVAATDIIPRRNRMVLQGILCATVSVICGLYVVLFPISVDVVAGDLYILMLNGEITYMLCTVLYYILSLYEMNRLIVAIHTPEERLSAGEIQQLKSRMLKLGGKRYRKKRNEEQV